MITVLLYSLILVLVSPTCSPFGLRLHYGSVLTDPSSPDKAVLYFNTHNICEDSYV